MKLSCIASGLILAVMLHTPVKLPHYTVVDLGKSFGDSKSFAAAINNDGQISGWVIQGNKRRAFIYNGRATVTWLLPEGRGVYFAAINVRGQVVGNNHGHAFLFSHGWLTSLGTLPGGDLSYADGIGENGVVTGESGTASQDGFHACLWQSGKIQDLGLLPQGEEANGLANNNRGQVTGWGMTKSGDYHAFLLCDGRIVDLGTLPQATMSRGNAINDAGQVTGLSEVPNHHVHAILYRDSQMIDLETPPGFTNSEGLALNNKGQVVGDCYCDPKSRSSHRATTHALLCERGRAVDLNRLIGPRHGWTLVLARGINDNRQIVGWGYHYGRCHAFLLTPSH